MQEVDDSTVTLEMPTSLNLWQWPRMHWTLTTRLDEAVNPSFDSDSRLRSDLNHVQKSFCDDWISHLEREDRVSLGLFCAFSSQSILTWETPKLLRLLEWWLVGLTSLWVSGGSNFLGEIPESKKGKYQKLGVLWPDESLNKKATQYIRENNVWRESQTLMSANFVSGLTMISSPMRYLSKGFQDNYWSKRHKYGWLSWVSVVYKKKGTYVDGHKCDEYRKTFLGRMVSHGFLNGSCTPPKEAKKALLSDIHGPSHKVIEKTVVMFHESTFQANEDQPTLWAKKGTMSQKNMVSDEHNWYLQLTDKGNDPMICKHVLQLFEYDTGHQRGLWLTSRKK